MTYFGMPHGSAFLALLWSILGNMSRPRRASRPRPYATPGPYRRPYLPALPALSLLPTHGPDQAPALVVRPYVLDDLHRARRRRARLVAVDRDRLGVAVLLDLGVDHPVPSPRDGADPIPRRFAAVAA